MSTSPSPVESLGQLMNDPGGPASSFEKLEAILTSPITYALAEQLPDKPPSGRPRDYPKFMWVVFHALVNYVWESSRRVSAEIGHEHVWGFMRRTVRRRFPDDPQMWLPKRPMRRWHYMHACRYLRDPKILKELKAVSRAEGTTLAKELGLFDEEAPMSWTHPDPDRFLQADGKVVTPLYKGRRGQRKVIEETGEARPVRFDPDATLHIEGGGNAAFGNKYVLVSARNERDRVLLDVGYDSGKKGDGGEAAVAMACFERLAPLVPGAQGVNYDKAMRGTHIDQAARGLGWLIQTGVHDVRDEHGKPLEWHIEDVNIKLADGSPITLRVYAREGAAGIGEMTETGETVFLPLERIKTERRGRAGRFRFYNVYRLPPECGGGEVRLRITGNEEDERRGLNRAEHLRAIPPPDPDFRRLGRRRNDAESINRGIEDTLYWGRSHSVGRVAQEADLLGFALGMNALSWHRHRKRKGAAAAA